MKQLTLGTLFFTFALSLALPKLGFSLATPPLFEKTSLARSVASHTYLYVFDFDFVNHLSQPIEIISVSVFDMTGNKVEQDWEASGPNWDPRLMTHALSGDHPLVKIISKPRGTPLEQATVSPVGDRITVTNRILSAGEAIRPSLYILSSKDKYDSLVLRVAYRTNGTLQVASRTFTVGVREEEGTASPRTTLVAPSAAPSALLPPVSQDDIDRAWKCGLSAGLGRLKTFGPEGEDLYLAIKATLVGRNLAENRDNLTKAAVKFGIDHIPLGACFEPIFFPPAAGGGAPPAAPTNLTVSLDPADGTVMRLTWQDNSYDEVSFQIFNGNGNRSAPAGTGTVEYTWTGLKPGSWNCFRVRANNGDTFSDWEPNTSPKCAYSSR